MKNSHLTILDIKKKLRDLNDDLETELNNKRINFERTQPASPTLKDIIVDTSHSSFDKFAHYVIKNSELDTKIVTLLEEINNYESLIIKRIKSIALANEKEAEVIILREDEKWKREHSGKPMEFHLIAEKVGYSEKQCRRIYKDFLNS